MMQAKLKTRKQLEAEGWEEAYYYTLRYYTLRKEGACNSIIIPEMSNRLGTIIEFPEFSHNSKPFQIEAYGFGWPNECFEWIGSPPSGITLTLPDGYEVSAGAITLAPSGEHTCEPVNVGFMSLVMACRTCGKDMPQ